MKFIIIDWQNWLQPLEDTLCHIVARLFWPKSTVFAWEKLSDKSPEGQDLWRLSGQSTSENFAGSCTVTVDGANTPEEAAFALLCSTNLPPEQR